MSDWTIIIFVGIGTLLLRASFLAILGDGAIAPALQRALRFVPAAVFPAITVPSIFYLGGEYSFAFDNYRIYAALIAAIIAHRTQNLTYTMAAGLGSLWILQAMFG